MWFGKRVLGDCRFTAADEILHSGLNLVLIRSLTAKIR
jgi:hypothetical protein